MADQDKPLSVVGFIPARSGSKRVADKNIRPLLGHPVMAYAIAGAQASGVFDTVVCATDSPHYAEIARHYGAEVPALRPAEISGDLAPDIQWIRFMLETLKSQGRHFDAFAILRPTNPFRTAATIRRAWDAFRAEPGVDSLRAVEKVKQHPCKMWVLRGNRMLPLIPFGPAEQPWHSSAYQALPEIYVQNASLEIAWVRMMEQTGTISGHAMMPFLTQGLEGFDVNYPEDWTEAEALVAAGLGSLPSIEKPFFRAG